MILKYIYYLMYDSMILYENIIYTNKFIPIISH